MEFFCYAYGRLSKEDLDKKAESDSIKNQRELIHDYIDRDPELHLVMEATMTATPEPASTGPTSGRCWRR